jgi:hypothetical protein
MLSELPKVDEISSSAWIVAFRIDEVLTQCLSDHGLSRKTDYSSELLTALARTVQVAINAEWRRRRNDLSGLRFSNPLAYRARQ